MVAKDHILAEIRRTAGENDGKPLGRVRFETETGIRPGEWERYWARWGDAVRDAGFEPNQKYGRSDDDRNLQHLALETRRLGRLPTGRELRLRRRRDDTFPGSGVFARLGSKRMLASSVAKYCEAHPDYQDVLEILRPLLDEEESAPGGHGREPEDFGYVYLLKSGRYYKLGKTNALGRREYELAIQLPEQATTVHGIKTDDPGGIERYWHRRFADRRKNGEWFELTSDDVSAFRRRKFM
jgi:hypothetical protein